MVGGGGDVRHKVNLDVITKDHFVSDTAVINGGVDASL